MEQQIQELQNRVRFLEDIIFSSKGMEINKIISKDQLIARGDGVTFTNSKNPAGCQIRTGSATDNASIIAEIGNVPNGSLYLSSATFQPFFVKYNGTWTLVNLP